MSHRDRQGVVVRQHRGAAGLLAAVLLGTVGLTGCTGSVPGRGAAATDGPGSASSGVPRFDESVTLVESRRLAYAVPRPDVVNDSFTRSCLPTLPLRNVAALGGFGGLFVDRSVEVFRRNGFVAGYVQCRSDPDTGRGLVAAAIEMRDAAAARRAATEVVPTLAGPHDRVAPLDGLSPATAIAGVNQDTGRQVLQTVIAFHRLVLYQYADDTDGDRVVSTAVSVLRAALDRAGEYRPTPLDQMPRLREDRRDLRRLLVEPEGGALVNGGGYDLDAYYGLAEDPDAERRLLSGAGFTAMYSNQGTHESYSVYELRDPTAARAVLDGFTAVDRRLHPDLVPLSVPVAGAPSSCFAFTDDSTPAQRCFFTAGRYLYQVDTFGFPAGGLADPGRISGPVAAQRDAAPR